MKVTINSSSPNRVSINSVKITQARTVGVGPASSLAGLADIDVSEASNNETLVYDESTQKFVVKPLPTVSGGEF